MFAPLPPLVIAASAGALVAAIVVGLYVQGRRDLVLEEYEERERRSRMLGLAIFSIICLALAYMSSRGDLSEVQPEVPFPLQSTPKVSLIWLILNAVIFAFALSMLAWRQNFDLSWMTTTVPLHYVSVGEDSCDASRNKDTNYDKDDIFSVDSGESCQVRTYRGGGCKRCASRHILVPQAYPVPQVHPPPLSQQDNVDHRGMEANADETLVSAKSLQIQQEREGRPQNVDWLEDDFDEVLILRRPVNSPVRLEVRGRGDRRAKRMLRDTAGHVLEREA